MAIDLALLENAGQVVHAKDLRRILRADQLGDGVVDSGGLDVTQRGAGANMSVDVAVGVGFIWDPTLLGLWPFISDTVVNLPVATADPTNPRIDLVVARVQDSEFSGSTDSKTLEVVTGTPAGSPAVPTAPDFSLPLAQIAVAAGATSITNANITERRKWTPSAYRGRGLVASGRMTNDAQTIASATPATLSGTSFTFTADAFRVYRLHFRARVSSDVAGDVAVVYFEADAASIGVQQDITCTVAGRSYDVDLTVDHMPGAGSHTYRVRVARGIGTGTVSFQASGRMTVADESGWVMS